LNRKRLIAGITGNWPAKVLSLGLAIIVFIFHRMSRLEERFISVPLRIEHLTSLMPSSAYPRMIRLTLRGEANSIYPILDGDIEVFAEMENFTAPGTYLVPLQWRKKGTALGVEPLQITADPAEISFQLDYKISKFVPLKPDFQGQVDPGFAMTSFSLQPNQIIIDGPADLMMNIAELYTEPIDLSGRRVDFNTTVNVMQSNPLIVIRGSGSIEFLAHISQIIPVRNITHVPITVTGLKEGLSGEPEIKTVNIHLEARNQEEAQKFEVPPDFIKVDCSGIIEPGDYILRVFADNAGDFKLRFDPEEVKIKIVLSGDKS